MPRKDKQMICSIEGCGRKVFARSWCGAHYKRWQRNASPEAGRTQNGEPLAFVNKIIEYKGDDCVIFPYARDSNGYAKIFVGGRVIGAYRYVCEMAHGLAPSDAHEAAHNCGKGHLGCISPRHLQWATHKENHQDRRRHGTSNAGETCGTAKLKVADVHWIRRTATQKSNAAIARTLGVTEGTVRAVLSGKTWGHV
jgi:hypothetical protein